MFENRNKLIIISIAAIALLVLFLFLPKQPLSVREKKEVSAIDADSLRLMQAIELVQGSNPMEGITILRELVSKDPNNVDAQYFLGEFSVKSGQYDKAISRLEKVLELRPEDLNYQVRVGLQYLEMDSVSRALKCFEKGVTLDSTDNNSLFFTAQIKESQEKNEEAAKLYRQLLRHCTDSVIVANVTQYIDNINKKLNP
jgi:tetratricopeptide (TPR) repeat protein